MTHINAPEGIRIERIEPTKDDSFLDVVRYRFSVDAHFEVAIVVEADQDPAYRQATIEHGVEHLAKGAINTLKQYVR